VAELWDLLQVTLEARSTGPDWVTEQEWRTNGGVVVHVVCLKKGLDSRGPFHVQGVNLGCEALLERYLHNMMCRTYIGRSACRGVGARHGFVSVGR